MFALLQKGVLQKSFFNNLFVKLFRIIDQYSEMILLKQNIVNTKKTYNLTFLRNLRTILLSFGKEKVLIIVIMRTFTPPNSPFFKKSFFYPSFLDVFPFLFSYVTFPFSYIKIINFLYISSYFICFSIFPFSHFFLLYFYFFFVKQFLIEPAIFI